MQSVWSKENLKVCRKAVEQEWGGNQNIKFPFSERHWNVEHLCKNIHKTLDFV